MRRSCPNSSPPSWSDVCLLWRRDFAQRAIQRPLLKDEITPQESVPGSLRLKGLAQAQHVEQKWLGGSVLLKLGPEILRLNQVFRCFKTGPKYVKYWSSMPWLNIIPSPQSAPNQSPLCMACGPTWAHEISKHNGSEFPGLPPLELKQRAGPVLAGNGIARRAEAKEEILNSRYSLQPKATMTMSINF